MVLALLETLHVKHRAAVMMFRSGWMQDLAVVVKAYILELLVPSIGSAEPSLQRAVAGKIMATCSLQDPDGKDPALKEEV